MIPPGLSNASFSSSGFPIAFIIKGAPTFSPFSCVIFHEQIIAVEGMIL